MSGFRRSDKIYLSILAVVLLGVTCGLAATAIILYVRQ